MLKNKSSSKKIQNKKVVIVRINGNVVTLSLTILNNYAEELMSAIKSFYNLIRRLT